MPLLIFNSIRFSCESSLKIPIAGNKRRKQSAARWLADALPVAKI